MKNYNTDSEETLQYFVEKFESAIKQKNARSALRRAKQISLLLDAAIIYMLAEKANE